MTLDEALDHVAEARRTSPPGRVEIALDERADPVTRQVLLLLTDPQLRPEHRSRIYEDLDSNRELLLERKDPRIVDLIFWSEHVDALYHGLRRGRVSTFHYARALDAACRRCGYDLLPAVGHMEELGREWARRQYPAAIALLSADVVELESPGEPSPELRP